MRFTIVVDYGKPYDIKVGSEKELKKELLKLRRIAEDGDYPYFDIWVYNYADIDVTDKIFEKFRM